MARSLESHSPGGVGACENAVTPRLALAPLGALELSLERAVI